MLEGSAAQGRVGGQLMNPALLREESVPSPTAPATHCRPKAGKSPSPWVLSRLPSLASFLGSSLPSQPILSEMDLGKRTELSFFFK